MRLEGKTAIVTGASSGMGKCICETFVKEGANVIAVARRAERLADLAAALEGEAGKFIACPGDMTKDEDVKNAFDVAVKKFGKLDILINNAGAMDDMSPIGDVEDERIEKVFKLNLYAPIKSMKIAVNLFKEQGNGGCIINVASEGAFHTCAGAIYAASKAALIALTQNTAFMYMPDGIRSNAIVPGGFKTEIGSSMGMPNMAGYARAEKVIALAPESGDPQEIAYAALFLASDEAKYISGENLFVDGGWCAM